LLGDKDVAYAVKLKITQCEQISSGSPLDYFLGRRGCASARVVMPSCAAATVVARRAKKPSTTMVDFLRHDSSNLRAVSAIALPCLPLFGSMAKLVTAYRDFFRIAVLAGVAVKPKA
jgi:hypothetical protein